MNTTPPQGPQLLSQTVGATRILTLSHPGQRNALHPDIYQAGLQALRDAAQDPKIRTVLLCGAQGHFCAGGQLQRLRDNRQRDPQHQAQSIAALHAWVHALHDCPKPVIAAVEGACAGAGFSLALACDLIVAADNSRWVMAYVNIGLSPDGGGSWRLAKDLPRATAMEWLLTGQAIAPQRLLSLGLVNELCPQGQAVEQAMRWCERLNAQAPNALASIKALVNDAPQRPLGEHLVTEQSAFVQQLFHPNAGIGIDAFLGKHTPQYQDDNGTPSAP